MWVRGVAPRDDRLRISLGENITAKECTPADQFEAFWRFGETTLWRARHRLDEGPAKILIGVTPKTRLAWLV